MPILRPASFVSRALVIAAAWLAPCAAFADPIIWNGPRITFTKPNFADWTQPENQDRLTNHVWLTRADIFPLFNIAVETESHGGPTDTEWAFGPTQPGIHGPISAGNHANLVFDSFANALGQNIGLNAVAFGPGVLHLISDDIYLNIRFRSWSRGGGVGGGFSYIRSTPGQPPVPEPATVTLLVVGAAVGVAARRRRQPDRRWSQTCRRRVTAAAPRASSARVAGSGTERL